MTIALVTGANRGLGAAIVTALLERGAQKVYAAARIPARYDDPRVVGIALDITRADQVRAAAEQASDVTVLINNAGVLHSGSVLDELDGARAEMETNYFGTLAMSRAFAPVLARNGGGAIVNVASVLSWLTMPRVAGYAASKAALWSLTNALRMELAAQGTQVVSAHAGFIDTDMAAGVDAPKISAAEVATQILDAVESGADDVLADPLTRKVGASIGVRSGAVA